MSHKHKKRGHGNRRVKGVKAKKARRARRIARRQKVAGQNQQAVAARRAGRQRRLARKAKAGRRYKFRKRRRARAKHGPNFKLHHKAYHAKDNVWGCLSGMDISSILKDASPEKEEAAHWTYSGEHGPEHWGALGFPMASNGKEQSPINIQKDAIENVDLPVLDIDYEDEDASILNNGHTVQVNWPAGSIKVGDKEYELLQFHFHSPSEHTIDGVSFPLEMHLVHKAADGQLAVVAILFSTKPTADDAATEYKVKQAIDSDSDSSSSDSGSSDSGSSDSGSGSDGSGGDDEEDEEDDDDVEAIYGVGLDNEFLDQFWDRMPMTEQEEGKEPLALGEIEIEGLKLSTKKYYRYMGSLTTPPCSEQVVWTVMKAGMICSEAQVAKFSQAIKNVKNNRPVQPLCARTVQK